MTMENKKNVPAIRFEGFTGNWRSKRFDKTFSMLCNNTLSRAALNYEKGSTKNVHYGDVLIKFGEYTDVAREDIPYISDDKIADKYITSRLQDGDIVFADTAEDATAGKCTELFNVQQQPIISGLHTIPCRPLFPFSTGYLGYFLNSPAYHNQLLPLMQGTKVVGISKTAIRETNVSFPDDTDEQQAIGKCFQNIDRLINTSQTKLDKLKNIKKACLEKMFPGKGSNTPELRFKGFKDEWCTKFLEDDEFNIVAGGDVDKEKLQSTGTYPVLANALVNDGIVGYYHDEYRITTPAVTVTGRGDVGYAKARKTNFTPVVRLLTIKSKHDVDYMENAINKHKVIVESTGVPQLTVPQIKKYEIWFPYNHKEEEQIGSFLLKLDTITDFYKNKINKLKNIKKACLNKMFVTGED